MYHTWFQFSVFSPCAVSSPKGTLAAVRPFPQIKMK
jgi:hypothetical protein